MAEKKRKSPPPFTLQHRMRIGTHMSSFTRLYRIWRGLNNRCNNINCKDYKNYGGRGIKVEWIKFEDFKIDMGSSYKFEDFKIDMGSSYKDNLQIDRIDVDKNYSKENCRWVTSKEQQNNRRNNRFHYYMGITDTINNWARFFGFNISTLQSRIKHGWSIERALTTNNPYYG